MAIEKLGSEPGYRHPILAEEASTQSALPRKRLVRPHPAHPPQGEGVRVTPSPTLPTRGREIVRFAAIVGLVLIGFLALLTIYAAATLPSLKGLSQTAGALKILDSQDRLVAEIGTQGHNRQPVTLNQVSPIMRQSVLAAEDRGFYREGAFDIPRILKALLVDTLAARPEQGASTITQQLARDALLTPQKSVLRKLREALLAQRIDGTYSKTQILQMYLNQVYFGENSYGVQDASETYFGKSAADLNLAEASLLAGILDAPSSNDPNLNPQGAFTRQHYVLGGLIGMHAITPAQAAAVDPVPADAHPTAAQRAQAQRAQQAILADLKNGHRGLVNLAPAFALYVQRELHQRFGENSRIFDQPLTVRTTLNVDFQQRAQQVVSLGVAQLGRGANNGALLMLDPSTGGILAMVGSADFNNPAIDGQFNVTLSRRQPGSSFKPYVYAAGFASGKLNPNTMLDDTPEESQALGGVQDWDHQYMGRIPAWEALLESRNIATEQAMQKAGVSTVIDLAHSLGIASPLDANLGTAIGASPVTMLEHAAGYAALANGGTTVSPHAILTVTDVQGHRLLDLSKPAPGQRVISPTAVCQVNGILQQYASQWNLSFNRPVDGKSGTTDSYKDAWFMTYSPQWVVATWVGRMGPNGSEGAMDQVFGTTMASYLAVPFVNGLPPSGVSPSCGVPSVGGGGEGDHGDHGDGGDGGGGGHGGGGGGGDGGGGD